MKRMFIKIIVTALALIVWTCVVFYGTVEGWFHPAIAKPGTTQSFIEATQKEIESHFTGNFAMAILEDGVVEREIFYSAGRLVDRNTVFQVSSLSKWISAFGVMKLVEDGKLDLDAPVSKYLTRWQLPSGEFDNDGVTVRRLLSHTAGLTDGLGYSGFEDGTPVQTIEQSLTKASDADNGASGSVRVGIEPGTAFRYSGGGYTLLQLLVEEVSGQPFDSFMKRSVFGPLGMIRSTYVWSDTSGYQLAEFYNTDSTQAKHYRYTSVAATSLYTSLSDLELFFQAHLDNQDGEPAGRNILKAGTVKMMREPHGRQMGVDVWGLGTILFANTDGGDFIIGHDGKSTPPVNTAVRLDPDTGDGIIILETGNPVIATRLASEWVFWKTGKVDTLLFPMLLNGMVWMIGTGWVLIVVGVVVLNRYHRGEGRKIAS